MYYEFIHSPGGVIWRSQDYTNIGSCNGLFQAITWTNDSLHLNPQMN